MVKSISKQQQQITTHLCRVIEIVTPQKIVLNGLWLGPNKPKTVIVWVHGLGSSMFSKIRLAEHLIDSQTAVLVFNNRGHATISRVSQLREKSMRGGAAHEVFTECIDDIEGAIRFARRQGAKKILLAGHSTGCQKSIYWASKKKGRGVKGIILLAPISDYAAEMHLRGKRKLAAAVSAAHALLGRRKKHSLLPENVWHETLDAQRFLSLYRGTGPEEIFTYWNPSVTPRTLRSVSIPILVLLAGNDEYADQSPEKMAAWFQMHLRNTKKSRVSIINLVEHSFRGGEGCIAMEIKVWRQSL